MSCPECEKITQRPDLPHVLRKCEHCEAELRIHEPGKHGIGFRIEKGDEIIVPRGWLKFSLNPLQSSGQFTRKGVQWFAKLIHIGDLPKKKDEIREEITKTEAACDEILRESLLLKDLNIECPNDFDKIQELLLKNRDCIEWWAYLTGIFLSCVRNAMEKSDIHEAVWAMGCVERCRSMMVFKQHLEEVVWMGQSAKRIVDILRKWEVTSLTQMKPSGILRSRKMHMRFRKCLPRRSYLFRTQRTLAE